MASPERKRAPRNRRKPPDPTKYNTHTLNARYNAAQSAKRRARSRKAAVNSTKRLPWRFITMILPLLMALYVLVGLWTD